MNEQELYSLLIPLADARLIVPRACIAEVVGYGAVESREPSPPWYLGVVTWNGRELPVISFEGACGQPLPEPGRRTRIVVFYAIGGKLSGGYFGMPTQGFPQLVRVNPGVLEAGTEDFAEDSPILCQPRMINEYPLIPDLERLEEMIVEAQSEAAPA